MKKVTQTFSVPAKSIIAKGLGTVDYCDSYQVSIRTNDRIDKITTAIFKVPGWVATLMNLRDCVGRVFGLKTDIQQKEADYYPIGSKAVYFTVIDRNENEIVMAEDDKHLNFHTSVLTDREGEHCCVNLTTIVHYNNFWGNLYFAPVKFFHQAIMKACMNRLVKQNS